LDVPTGEGRDLSTIRTAQLIGRQEGRERRPGPDGFRRDGDNELQEILSGGGTLGELEESGEPTLEDGGGQFDDVPDDFTSRPTAFEGFQPADTGVEQPTFPEIDPGTGLGIGSSQPPLVPPAVIELPEQGQLTPQTAGLDVFTTPETDIDTDIDFDADVDQPTPTPPEPDFETPTPMTTPTDTSTRFGQADATATPTDTRGGRGPPRTDLPEFDDDEPDEDPMFIGELQGIQAIDARLDPVEFDDV
jgi:hypothetical protein